MKKYLNLLLPLLIGFISCAKVETVNLKSHTFSERPRYIVWVQIAGLSDEHIAMLRFNLPKVEQKTAFEKVLCTGQLWSYNLYNLRPSPREGLLSQVVGSKNVNGSCQDFEKEPVWNFVDSLGGKTGIFESGVNNDTSLSRSLSCKGKAKNFLGKTTVLRMDSSFKEKASAFHYQSKTELEKGKVYFDKSCQNGVCYASMLNNVRAMWNNHIKSGNLGMFLIRDFSYYNSLKRKNISEARETLSDIEKILIFFQKEQEKNKKLLLIVSSSSAQKFEFPAQGRDWASYEKKGKKIIFRNTSLISPVTAVGPSAENFCGIYEEASMLKRVLWSPVKNKIFNNFFNLQN